METRVKKRIWAFAVSGALLAFFLILGFANSGSFGGYLAMGILSFTFSSCLILSNNFIPDLVGGIISWSFVQMPGVIFTLDLDGLIWLLTVKLLFWILGIILGIVCTILAIVVGAIVSVFVYPYAIIKNFKGADENEI